MRFGHSIIFQLFFCWLKMVYAIRFFNKFPTFSRLCMRFVATIVKQTKIYTQKQRKCIKQPTVNEKKLLEICWCPQLFCRERVRKFVDSTFVFNKFPTNLLKICWKAKSHTLYWNVLNVFNVVFSLCTVLQELSRTKWYLVLFNVNCLQENKVNFKYIIYHERDQQLFMILLRWKTSKSAVCECLSIEFEWSYSRISRILCDDKSFWKHRIEYLDVAARSSTVFELRMVGWSAVRISEQIWRASARSWNCWRVTVGNGITHWSIRSLKIPRGWMPEMRKSHVARQKSDCR